jgi:hypothetical protein
MEESILQDSPEGLQIDDNTTAWLSKAAYWARVVAYIFSAFVLLIFLFLLYVLSAAGSMFSQYLGESFTRFASLGMAIGLTFAKLLITLAALFFAFYIYLLFHFAYKVRKGLATGNQSDIVQGMRSLKIFLILNIIIGVLGILSFLTKL